MVEIHHLLTSTLITSILLSALPPWSLRLSGEARQNRDEKEHRICLRIYLHNHFVDWRVVEEYADD